LTKALSSSAAMIYLIGVRHDIQFDPAPHRAKIVRDKRESFKTHVLEVIENLGISILAEEFNEDAKKLWRVSETTLEQVAKTKGIEHRFCMPGREEVWLSQIEDSKHRNVLFVCGDDHYDSFSATLLAAEFDIKHGPRYRISAEEEWRDL
jgi:hypothetical protein